MSSKSPRVLVTGALGQLGTALTYCLKSELGPSNVVTSDVRKNFTTHEPYMFLDVASQQQLRAAVVNYDIDWIVHLSAIMSVKGELYPDAALELNVEGVRSVLEVSRSFNLRCFIPSSMAVYNADAGKNMTPEDTILNPITIYGITKVFAEQLGGYYHRKYGVDFRCLRFPGLISPEVLPGGGTTDYAIHMLHAAVRGVPYSCPVLQDEPLPMMALDDAVKGSSRFLQVSRNLLKRSVYNVAAFSFTPSQLADEIRKTKGIEVTYSRGPAHEIASSWPDSMDDSAARRDWGWLSTCTFEQLVEQMLRDIPRYHPI